jgi:hypothetical protein
MKKKMTVLVVLGLLWFPAVSMAFTFQGSDGHWYNYVAGKTTWTSANSFVPGDLGLPWKLATVDSQQEIDFIIGKLNSPFDVWIGGFQAPGSTGLGDNWSWVAGGTISSSGGFWGSFEPNDCGSVGSCNQEDGEENYLGFINGFFGYAGKWHDAPDGWSQNQGALYEAVPVPGAVWLLGSGLVGVVMLRRSRNK